MQRHVVANNISDDMWSQIINNLQQHMSSQKMLSLMTQIVVINDQMNPILMFG